MANEPRNVVVAPELTTVFPPLSLFLEVRAALSALAANDPVAAAAVPLLEAAIMEHERSLTHLIRDAEAAASHAQAHPAPPIDLKGMDRQLKKSGEALETYLARVVPPSELEELHKTHAGSLAVAEALAELSSSVRNVPADLGPLLSTLSSSVRAEADAYKKAKQRVDTGGHAALDEATSKLVTKLWAELDGGYLTLEACLLRAGVSFDTVLATQPAYTSGNKLRRRVKAGEPTTPRPNPRNSKAKRQKNETKGSDSPPKKDAAPPSQTQSSKSPGSDGDTKRT